MSTQLPLMPRCFSLFDRAGGERRCGQVSRRIAANLAAEHAGAIEDVRQGINNMEAGLGRPFEEVDAAIPKDA